MKKPSNRPVHPTTLNPEQLRGVSGGFLDFVKEAIDAATQTSTGTSTTTYEVKAPRRDAQTIYY